MSVHWNVKNVSCRVKKPYNPKDKDRVRGRWSRMTPAQRAARNETRRRKYIQDLYGISYEKYQEMRESQGNRCAICSREPRTLYVDHCHNTGVVRGLLCNRCNLGIGQFSDDAELLVMASDYLKTSHAKEPKILWTR